MVASGRDAALSPIDHTGHSVNGAELEIAVNETADDLLLEVINSRQEVLAAAVVTISEMLQVELPGEAG